VPELPEVETVRAGLTRWALGRTISHVDSLHPRAVRRHALGPEHLAANLAGRTITSVDRRGKYLWFTLDSDAANAETKNAGPEIPEDAGQATACLIAHLGMSGQLLMLAPGTADGPHLRARISFADGGLELRFVDQRTFGGIHLDRLTADGPTQIPAEIAHIARDPLDPLFNDRAWSAGVRRRRTTIKRVLLDQSSISGVGNIYADESLWRARLHGDRAVSGLTAGQLRVLLADLRAVLSEALAAGGTSFDSLYVNVNGQSGYFDRSLNAYGRAGKPCRRCGTGIVRQKWMNRSSYFCPRCQPLPPALGTKLGTNGSITVK
jgi:formamidopyrimidine-DNA glycosylase